MKKLFTFFRPVAIGLIMLFSSGWAVGQIPNAWINEIHYDNTGTDSGEAVEIIVENSGSWDISKLRVDLYNGNGGGIYGGAALSTYTLGNISGNFTIYSKAISGIQNGAPDGVALSYDGTLIQFLSYEGSFTATDGPANGIVSTDILVSEPSSPVNESLQLSGSGTSYSDYSWQSPATETFGEINNGQTFKTTTWIGTTDTDWTNAGNWSGGVPSSLFNAIIPNATTNDPIISNTTTSNCKGLILEGDATLNIVSDASNSGSLIFGGTYTGSATAVTYKRYFTDTKEQMFGSPLSGQTIDNAFLNDNSIDGMIHYLEASDSWSVNYTTTLPSSPYNAFAWGTGYMAKRDGSGVVNLTGTPNNAAVDISLTRSTNGWNLLSNPFTSAINATITAHTTNNLITANSANLDPSYAALYIWNQGTTSYLIINNAGEGSLVQYYLQVAQGFFVKSKTGGGTFTMTPAMQSHQTAIAFKSSEETSWASIILNAEINDAKESTKILFREDMSSGLDIGYDAGVFKSNPDFSLYSRLVEDNGIDFGLQCLPSNYNELIIPIGLDAKAGEIVKFSINALNIPEEYAVILEDRTANTFTNLSDETAEYTIQLTNDSDGTGRFFIHTSFKSALEIDDLATVNAFQVFSRAKDHQLVIRGNANENATARIYSITGKQIAVVNLKQSAENIIPFNEEAGVYIVQITNEGGTQTQKFIWVK